MSTHLTPLVEGLGTDEELGVGIMLKLQMSASLSSNSSVG